MPKTEKREAKVKKRKISSPKEPAKLISIHSKKGAKIIAKSTKTGQIGVIKPKIKIIQTKKSRPILNGDDLAEAKRIRAKAKRKAEQAELKVGSDLTLKQEKFCKLYASDREFFGNGTQSYIEAYDPDTSKPNWYKSAMSSASRLLSNVKIIERINSLLEETGFNDVAVDKQTSFLIHQHADFTNKLGAIREYNKIRDRYPKQKIEHSGQVEVIELTSFGSEKGDDDKNS